MWYVIQVMGGQEEKTARLLRKQIAPSVMEECFIPRKERIKKFKGNWRRVEETIFPGYVFTATEQPEELFIKLKDVPRLTKLLQDGIFHFLPLSKEEEKLIRTMSDNYHVTRISKVQVGKQSCDVQIDPGQNVVILDGPLKGQEGRIVKYHLHKREAVIKLPFMGNELELKLGIELVANKSEKNER